VGNPSEETYCRPNRNLQIIFQELGFGSSLSNDKMGYSGCIKFLKSAARQPGKVDEPFTPSALTCSQSFLILRALLPCLKTAIPT